MRAAAISRRRSHSLRKISSVAIRNLAERLTHHPGDTQKVAHAVEEIMSTTIAGDFRTLLESAASALE